jgi:trans-aconitate methyltransferase
MKLFYEAMYRYFRTSRDMGPRRDLISLVESARLRPRRAIDLGSGSANNTIFLAENGFDVTGVDFAPAAIEKGSPRRRGCRRAGRLLCR